MVRVDGEGRVVREDGEERVAREDGEGRVVRVGMEGRGGEGGERMAYLGLMLMYTWLSLRPRSSAPRHPDTPPEKSPAHTIHIKLKIPASLDSESLPFARAHQPQV